MSKLVINQDYQKYLHNRALQIGVKAALQETYAGKAKKDFKQIKESEQKAEQKLIKDAEKAKQKAEQKRIKDAEKAEQKAEQKRIKDVEKAEQKRIKDAEKAEQKAEQKRIKDAEKAKQKAEQKRIKDAEKAEQKRIKDAEKAKQKAEQKRIKDAEKAEQKVAKPKIHKRNVNESMKKQVASEQNWRCKKCGMNLPGNYEIDHIKPIKNGGLNDRVNLQALCRNCHGEKTQRETAGIKEHKKLTMTQMFEQKGYTFAKDTRLRR